MKRTLPISCCSRSSGPRPRAPRRRRRTTCRARELLAAASSVGSSVGDASTSGSRGGAEYTSGPNLVLSCQYPIICEGGGRPLSGDWARARGAGAGAGARAARAGGGAWRVTSQAPVGGWRRGRAPPRRGRRWLLLVVGEARVEDLRRVLADLCAAARRRAVEQGSRRAQRRRARGRAQRRRRAARALVSRRAAVAAAPLWSIGSESAETNASFLPLCLACSGRRPRSGGSRRRGSAERADHPPAVGEMPVSSLFIRTSTSADWSTRVGLSEPTSIGARPSAFMMSSAMALRMPSPWRWRASRSLRSSDRPSVSIEKTGPRRWGTTSPWTESKSPSCRSIVARRET